MPVTIRCCLIGLLPLAACTATVVSPAIVADPVQVFVLREAKHAGLVLPRPDGNGFVEFGFGDFAWYVLGWDHLQDVAATVLWPTPGVLVRRQWAARDAGHLAAEAWYCELQPVVVERPAAMRLALQLEHEFSSGREGILSQAGSALQFVRRDRGYWLLYNCCDAVAEWLGELDCTVSWVPVRTALQVSSR